MPYQVILFAIPYLNITIGLLIIYQITTGELPDEPVLSLLTLLYLLFYYIYPKVVYRELDDEEEDRFEAVLTEDEELDSIDEMLAEIEEEYRTDMMIAEIEKRAMRNELPPEIVKEVRYDELPSKKESKFPNIQLFNTHSNSQICHICKHQINPSDSISKCNHCGHEFHRSHLYAYVQSTGVCAVCKEGLTLTEI